jgi:hypothetical protein
MRVYFEFDAYVKFRILYWVDAYFKFKIRILVWVLNIVYLMLEDGQYVRNMSNVLGLIKRVVVYRDTYGSF